MEVSKDLCKILKLKVIVITIYLQIQVPLSQKFKWYMNHLNLIHVWETASIFQFSAKSFWIIQKYDVK